MRHLAIARSSLIARPAAIVHRLHNMRRAKEKVVASSTSSRAFTANRRSHSVLKRSDCWRRSVAEPGAGADSRRESFSGFLAWFLWRGIYWSKLPRIEKKVRVAIDWALDVFFYERFRAVSRSTRTGTYADRDPHGAVEPRAALSSGKGR